MARTSSEVRDEVTTARAKFEEVRRAYLANEVTRDAFQDADHAVFLLERELGQAEEREHQAAAVEAEKARAQAAREARIAEAEELQLRVGPWRKMLDEALTDYQSKNTIDRADMKAIVEGKLAEDRMRERSLALWAEHERLNVLREKVGEPPQGDTPPTAEIIIEQFGRAVEHVLYSETAIEANAGGVERFLLDMAIDLVVEAGGPDRRLRAPNLEADTDAAAVAAAKRAVLDAEVLAERIRQQWMDVSVKAPAWRDLGDQLQAAQRGVEEARQEVEERSLTLRHRGIDAGLIAPAAPPPDPAAAAKPSLNFRERFAHLFT